MSKKPRRRPDQGTPMRHRPHILAATQFGIYPLLLRLQEVLEPNNDCLDNLEDSKERVSGTPFAEL